MGKFIDLTGKSYGKLTVLRRDGYLGKEIAWLCRCECVPEILKDKTVAAVHFDSDGKLTEMPGKRMMIDGIEYYVFETTHFSEFGLVDAVDAGLVKTDDSKDKVKEAKSIVSKMNLTAVTSKTTKKNVKVTVTMNKKTSSDIKALKKLGYTVKYRYYRSTKKSAGYKSKITKKTNTYINTCHNDSNAHISIRCFFFTDIMVNVLKLTAM